jgi:hypothetical protein
VRQTRTPERVFRAEIELDEQAELAIERDRFARSLHNLSNEAFHDAMTMYDEAERRETT